MDNNRMRAYRYLLYHAIIEFRCLGQTPAEMRRVEAIAYWLHNLALYSAHDFDGFQEESFWHYYEMLNEKNPDYHLSNFKKVFETVLAGNIGSHKRG